MQEINGLDRVLVQMTEKVATISVTRWWAGKKKSELSAPVFFRRLDVLEVHAVTGRAVEVTFRFSKDVCANCNVCGKTLETEVSRATGIGPTCCSRIGVARKSKNDSKAVLEALDAIVDHFGTARAWIPNSQFTLDSGALVAPVKAPEVKPVVFLEADQIQIAAWLAKKNYIPEVLTVIRKLKETDKWLLLLTPQGKIGIPKSQIINGKVA